MSPFFSIIIPTYNRGYCIWKAILSVQKQIWADWELLVVDDGSTDNTKQVVAEFQQDSRIRYFKVKNGRDCRAKNFALKKAKGEVITYLDDDDILYNNFLSVAYEYFNKYPKKVFAIPNYNRRLELYDGNFKMIDFTNATSAQKIDVKLQDFFHWNVKTCGTGILHKRSVLSKGIKWDPHMLVFQDWDFIMQLGTAYPNGFMHIPLALFEYSQRYGGDAMCSNTTYKEWAEGYEKIYQKHKKDPLLAGQTWYPDRIEKYSKLQMLVDLGKEPPAVYKYFPKYYKKS